MHSDVLTTSPATCCVPSISDEDSECDVMLSDLVALSADTYGILFQKCSDVLTYHSRRYNLRYWW